LQATEVMIAGALVRLAPVVVMWVTGLAVEEGRASSGAVGVELSASLLAGYHAGGDDGTGPTGLGLGSFGASYVSSAESGVGFGARAALLASFQESCRGGCALAIVPGLRYTFGSMEPALVLSLGLGYQYLWMGGHSDFNAHLFHAELEVGRRVRVSRKLAVRIGARFWFALGRVGDVDPDQYYAESTVMGLSLAELVVGLELDL